MKVKIDENVPARLVAELTRLGHHVDTVASEGLQGKPDDVVWAAAQRERRLLITQDLDFSDVRRFRPGTHAGLLLVRLREPGATALFNRIAAVARDEGLELLEGCFAVLTDRKLRIRRP
jgi:predicted nuclease of predicted toxin-antitoxin system